jgi:hypothetical protein
MNWRVAIPPLPVTKEHGSWAVLAVPLIVGTAAAQLISWEHFALAAAAFAVFLAYVPVQLLIVPSEASGTRAAARRSARFWAAVLLGIASLFAGALLVLGEYHLLMWAMLAGIGFVGHEMLSRGKGKSMWADLSAAWGLSVGTPAAAMIGSSRSDVDIVLLWAEVFLFFSCTVVYVYMKIRATSSKFAQPSLQARLRFGWITVAYHVLVIAIVGAIVVHDRHHALALVAFVPMAVHAVVGTVRLTGRVRFKRLGLLLLTHSILFAVIMIVALRGPQ